MGQAIKITLISAFIAFAAPTKTFFNGFYWVKAPFENTIHEVACAKFNLRATQASIPMQWNSTSLRAVANGLGMSIYQNGIKSCCLPSMYCLGDNECYTNGYNTEYQNLGSLGAVNVFPIFTCVPPLSGIPIPQLNPQKGNAISIGVLKIVPDTVYVMGPSAYITIYSELSLPIAHGLSNDADQVQVTFSQQNRDDIADKSCDAVHVCRSPCQPCGDGNPCSAGDICIATQPGVFAGYCAPLCVAPAGNSPRTAATCPCGGFCYDLNDYNGIISLCLPTPTIQDLSTMCRPGDPSAITVYPSDVAIGPFNSKFTCRLPKNMCIDTFDVTVTANGYEYHGASAALSTVKVIPIAVACTTNFDCDDNDICTQDICSIENCCLHVPSLICDSQDPLFKTNKKYTTASYVPMEWEEIVPKNDPSTSPLSHTSLASYTDDTPLDPVSLPFSFPFYESLLKSVYISPNGVLLLQPTPPCGESFGGNNCGIANYKGYIAPLLNDFDPSSRNDASIYWDYGGMPAKDPTGTDSKYSQLKVVWYNIPSYTDTPSPSDPRYIFSSTLFSNGGIVLRYTDYQNYSVFGGTARNWLSGIRALSGESIDPIAIASGPTPSDLTSPLFSKAAQQGKVVDRIVSMCRFSPGSACMTPRCGSAGTLVKIQVPDFVCAERNVTFSCRFGSISTAGELIDGNVVSCKVPYVAEFAMSANTTKVSVSVFLHDSSINATEQSLQPDGLQLPLPATTLLSSSFLSHSLFFTYGACDPASLYDSCTCNSCGLCVPAGTGEWFYTSPVTSGIPVKQRLVKDCNGDCFGTSVVDTCGVCTGGNTQKVFNQDLDCQGICFGMSTTCQPTTLATTLTTTTLQTQPNTPSKSSPSIRTTTTTTAVSAPDALQNAASSDLTPATARDLYSRWIVGSCLMSIVGFLLCVGVYHASSFQRQTWNLLDNFTEVIQMRDQLGFVPDVNAADGELPAAPIARLDARGATEIELASIPIRAVFSHADVGRSGDCCSVCLVNFESLDEIRELSCHHVFHSDCIVQWLRVSHLCPLCKGTVRSPTSNRERVSGAVVVDALSRIDAGL